MVEDRVSHGCRWPAKHNGQECDLLDFDALPISGDAVVGFLQDATRLVVDERPTVEQVSAPEPRQSRQMNT
jgi:hypothetical protein